MDFTLSPEHVALRDAVQQVCDDHLPIERLTTGTLPEASPAAWSALADLGLFGLLAVGDVGGSGLTAREAAIAFERLGAHLAPGPLLWTTLGATVLDDTAPEIVAGTHTVGAIDPMQADGDPVLVEHGLEVDTLLVLGDAGVTACDRAAVAALATEADPLDPLTPVARLAAVPDGTAVAGPEQARWLIHMATLLTASMAAGVAQQALDVAAAYCLERHQFDVPIGSFQAPKHLLADMYVRASLASTSALAAAATVDLLEVGDADRACHEAKLLAGEAAIANSRTAVQLLGGMGFTWDMPPNFLLKRAWVLEHALGTGGAHALAVAGTLGGTP